MKSNLHGKYEIKPCARRNNARIQPLGGHILLNRRYDVLRFFIAVLIVVESVLPTLIGAIQVASVDKRTVSFSTSSVLDSPAIFKLSHRQRPCNKACRSNVTGHCARETARRAR